MSNNPFEYLKNLKINLDNNHSTDWVEEAYCTKNLSGESLGVSVKRKNSFILLFIIIIALSALLFRAFYLQIIKGEQYQNLSDTNRIRTEIQKTNRGLIKDRNYKDLVFNEPYFNVFLIPANLPKEEANYYILLKKLSLLTKLTEEEIHEKINNISERQSSYYHPQLIAENILLPNIWQILILSKKFPAIYIEVDSYRKYITDEENLKSLSHILGYEGKISSNELKSYEKKDYLLTDKIGKSGIEATYEDYLRGKHGKIFWEVDAFLRPQKILYEEDKIPGDNLVLTIDLEYQKKLEEVVKENLKELNLKKAAAIVMNPNNGEILAMVSWPTYNNNDFSLGIASDKYQKLINNKNLPLYNKAISGKYPPGSTFKLITAAAALEENIVDDNDYFMSTGGIEVGQWFFPDWKSTGHGKTNIYKALAESVNTYFYMVGGGDKDFNGLGVKKLARYADKFNLGRQLGIDLANESSGFIPTPEWKKENKHEDWYIGDTYHMSIGQGDVAVTPLQVAEYTSYFANGGKLFVPHLVKERHNDVLNNHERFDPIIIRENIISKENTKIIQKALRQTVTDGSGKALNYLDVEVAGKTGTAQWRLDEEPHAWWTCYAPYKNPEIVLTVFVEEGGEGTDSAVPIANDFLYWWSSIR